MIDALKKAWANFRGFDLTGSTVPPMDGPLRPNAKLDAMPMALWLEDVDNLASAEGRIVCSVGNEMLTLQPEAGGGSALAISGRHAFDGVVTSISAWFDQLAVAVEGKGIILEAPGAAPRLIAPAGMALACITAMAFAGKSTLFVAVGSDKNPCSEWKRDLMTNTAAGSVWRIDLGTGTAKRIADGLAFPAGIAVSGNTVFVSEAWKHRILSFDRDGSNRSLALSSLPAYPGRIVTSPDGFWLAMFAPRNPLVEFVLKEAPIASGWSLRSTPPTGSPLPSSPARASSNLYKAARARSLTC